MLNKNGSYECCFLYISNGKKSRQTNDLQKNKLKEVFFTVTIKILSKIILSVITKNASKKLK